MVLFESILIPPLVLLVTCIGEGLGLFSPLFMVIPCRRQKSVGGYMTLSHHLCRRWTCRRSIISCILFDVSDSWYNYAVTM